MRCAFDFYDGLAIVDGVVAVLEVEAEGEVGCVLKEDVSNGAADGVVD